MIVGVDLDVSWAGVGAFMAGFGSLLSGIAAYRLATRKTKDEPEREDGGPPG